MSVQRIEIPEDVIFQPLQGEMVLLNLKDQQYFGLDDVGADMWKLIVEFGDPEIVTERFCAEYAVDKATARRDLDSLIRDLTAAGLLRAREAGDISAASALHD